MPLTDRLPPVLDRPVLADWFARNRTRSDALFDLVDPGTYLERPIPLRHPIVFYEGHLPVFNVNTVLKKALGHPGFNAEFERLFARGIDPEDEAAAGRRAIDIWPSREAIRAYGAAVDPVVADAIRTGPIEGADREVVRGAQAVFASLEHEAMHHETLLYIFHRLPHDRKRRPGTSRLVPGGAPPPPATVRIAAGRATLGADRGAIPFGWDNEFDGQVVDVPAFEIDVYDVTNEAYLAFVEAGGYTDRALWTDEGWRWRDAHDVRHPLFWERRGDGWVWRAQFEEVPLPRAWPVFVSHAEASAYARWRGRRLPTEAEFHRAAYGTPEGGERAYPWGDAPPDGSRGNFDFAHWDPVPVGSYPAGRSAWGVHDLVGNGWEWTSSVFAPLPGFRPMASYPEYSADFFDAGHFVIKGASPVTARELLRRSFRNWFRPAYPYVYATFRLAG